MAELFVMSAEVFKTVVKAHVPPAHATENESLFAHLFSSVFERNAVHDFSGLKVCVVCLAQSLVVLQCVALPGIVGVNHYRQ